ncbi:5-formyltetrahydrofolate cyclo-ligase [Thauera sinica]|nr:5-formyltetrahydrofolate cyclo-ligase [Thauera sp. K11]ATE61397.1 5-formyltetrahydrofolate cyclo-ligase [Thauera sp. K11]
MRDQALAARQALSGEHRAALTERLAGHLDGLVACLAPAVLGFCWPYRAEPDLRGWVVRWLAGGGARIAALPVVIGRGQAMAFRPWTPDCAMQPDRHGIPHPVEGGFVVPDVVLVPLNAFDAEGFRLGYGGGYFDRTLARMRPLAVGVGFEVGRVASVCPQPHDVPMDWIVTEAGAARAIRR